MKNHPSSVTAPSDRPGRPARVERTPSIGGRLEIGRAFTLVELLTVVAVIGVLVGLSMLILPRVTMNARRAKCLSNLRQVGSAVMLYVGDHHGSYPSGTWDTLVMPYAGVSGTLAATDLLKCPEDPRPLNLETGGFARSYAFSAMDTSRPYDGIIQGTGTYRRSAQIVSPSTTLMLFDFYTSHSGGLVDNRQWSGAYAYITGWLGTNGIPLAADLGYYHGKTMNFGFADGHVESMAAEHAYTPRNLWRAVE